MSISPRLLLNGLLFQAGWWLCAGGGNAVAVPTVLIILSIHWFFISRERAEWLCLVLIAVGGVGLDAVLHYFKILQFADATVFGLPFWLLALWLLFSTTLNHSLRWLQTRPWLAAACGAVGGPLSYWGGVQLGAAQFGIDALPACAILALCWSLLLPMAGAMMRHRTRVMLYVCNR